MNPMQSKVALLNNIAGKTATTDWSLIRRQWQLVESELNEAKDSINNKDFHGLRDDIADVLVTALGLAHLIGVDAEADFNAVFEALLTRFDMTEEDSEKTMKKYTDMGIRTHIHVHKTESQTFYVTKSSLDQFDYKGEFYPKDKFLKSFQYRQEVLPAAPADCPFIINESNKEPA